MLDKYNRGFVAAADLIESLADLGIFPHKDDVYLYIRRYDRNGDGKISFQEFSDAMIPVDVAQAASLLRRPAHHSTNGYNPARYFMMETREMLLHTLRLQLNGEDQVEMIRKRLCQRPGFSVHEAFQVIDRDQNGYLTTNELCTTLA